MGAQHLCFRCELPTCGGKKWHFHTWKYWKYFLWCPMSSKCTERGHLNMGYIYILASSTRAIIMCCAEYKPRDGWLSWRKFNFCLPAIHACVVFKKSVNSFPETRTRQHYEGKFFSLQKWLNAVWKIGLYHCGSGHASLTDLLSFHRNRNNMEYK